MQYVLIELEGTTSTRVVDVPAPPLDPLYTTQIPVLATTRLEVVVTPGAQLYQCIRDGNVVGYKTLDGQDTTFFGGSYVLDANPPTPAWDVPDAPVVPELVVTPRIITKLDYMNRFHDGELAAIYTAAKNVVQIEVWLEKFKVSENIDLSDPRTIGGVQALEAAGLIGVGRANEILA